MKVLAIIPARGGSKGVPRKNIKNLAGKPLIAYTISAAKESNCFESIIVSTEDKEIADIAQDLGAEVPFLRPADLAKDETPTLDAVIHVVTELESSGRYYDAVCVLQPTNPLRSSETIKEAQAHFEREEFDSLVTVRSVPHEYNPHWVFELKEDCTLVVSTGDNKVISRRQDLPKCVHRDGAVYLVKTAVLKETRSLYGKKIGYLDCTNLDYVNIDTEEDWNKANELFFRTSL